MKIEQKELIQCGLRKASKYTYKMKPQTKTMKISSIFIISSISNQLCLTIRTRKTQKQTKRSYDIQNEIMIYEMCHRQLITTNIESLK